MSAAEPMSFAFPASTPVAALSVSISPLNQTDLTVPHATTTTATVTGGIGPFTYLWTWSGNSGILLSNETTAVCTQSSGVPLNSTWSGTITVTVTDTGFGGNQVQASTTVTHYNQPD